MVKVYLNNIYISKDILRNSKLYSKHFRTTSSSTLILPFFLWKIIEVYNGKKYIPITINKRKVGFLFKNFLLKKKIKLLESEYTLKINN